MLILNYTEVIYQVMEKSGLMKNIVILLIIDLQKDNQVFTIEVLTLQKQLLLNNLVPLEK